MAVMPVRPARPPSGSSSSRSCWSLRPSCTSLAAGERVGERRKNSVVDQDGTFAHIRGFTVDTTGAVTAVVELANGSQIAVPAQVLRPDEHGGYAVPARWHQFATR